MRYTAGILSRAIAMYPDNPLQADYAMIREANGLSNREMRALSVPAFNEMRAEQMVESIPVPYRIVQGGSKAFVVTECVCECVCDKCTLLTECGVCECAAEVICEMPEINAGHLMDAAGNPVAMAQGLTGKVFNDQMTLQQAMTIMAAVNSIQNRAADCPFPLGKTP